MIPCAVCAVEFTPKTPRAKYCSRPCKDKGKPSANGLNCSICGRRMTKGRTSSEQGLAAHNQCRKDAGLIRAHGASGYRRGCRCPECKAGQATHTAAYVASVKEKHGLHPTTLRRKKFKADHGYWPQEGGSDWIAPTERRALYERDNWTCQLCHEPIDPSAHWNSNYAPSLDHIVPQSHMLIPDHTPSNLRTAHRVCNSRRGADVDAYQQPTAHQLDKAQQAKSSSTPRRNPLLALQ